MKFKYKNLLVPVILTILSGCDSDDEQNSSISKGGKNAAPVLNVEALETTYSTTYTNEDGDLEWDFTFSESDGNWDDPKASRKVDYYEVDLLTGITDADFGDNLTVKDVTFMWVGPDCGNTTATAPAYPEICYPILEELGLMEDDGEGGRKPINTTFDQEEDIRELQNLPLISTPLYGFELKQDSIKVTPTMFAPILVTGQTASLGVFYSVTDGVDTIKRRIRIVVEGSDMAPEFIKLNKYGEPVLDENGNKQSLSTIPPSVSEKDSPVAINLIAGIFDQDMYDVAQTEKDVGDLSNIYNLYDRSDFTRETLSVHSFTPPADILPNTYSVLTEGKEGFGAVSYNLVVDPSTYADALVKGETKVLTFTYTVSDGTNDVVKSIDFSIKGANEFNEPSFDEPKVNKVILTTDNFQLVSLLEGVSDPEGDDMTIVDFQASSSDEEYGLLATNAESNGTIAIDPYFFTYLKPGEEKTFTYTYKVSDGNLVSTERTFNIVLTGANINLLAKAEKGDPGLELYNLADGPFSWQWSNANNGNATNVLSVDPIAAHTGGFGLNITDGNMYTRLNKNGIQQGVIVEGDSFYLNYFAKMPQAWGSINAIFNKEGVWNQVALEKATGNLGSTNWVEHTVTVPAASDFFTTQSTFDITFHSQQGIMDDFSIVKYNYLVTRDLVPEGTFNLPDAGGWQVSGDAVLEVLESANRYQNTVDTQYGLKVTGGAATTELYLDSSVLPQGAVKKGMRYIVSFDLKDEGFVAQPTGSGPAPLNVMFKEEGGTHIARRLYYADQTTAWSHYDLHINTVSDGNDLNGVVNTDVDFDWSTAATRFALQIPAGKTFFIDNIRVFPVPQ